MKSVVDVSSSESVCRINLNSPGTRNALSRRMIADLTAAFVAADADPDIRVVVLDHAGGTFCAGADLTETGDSPRDGSVQVVELLRTIVGLGTPVIVVVRGHARAGGLGIVGAGDIAIAGPESTFAFSEVRIGVAPVIISVTTMSRMNPRATSRYYLTGERFGPKEAVGIGLVTDAVDDVDAAVDETLASIRLCSPAGLRASKDLVNQQMRTDLERWGPFLASHSAALFAGPEAVEGVTAFRERRLPAWVQQPPA